MADANETLYGPKVESIASKYGIPSGLLSAIVKQESNFNPAAIGVKNANGTYDYGIMQLNSKYFPNAAGMSVDQQIETGAKLLADNYKSTGDWYQAVRAYNGGLTGIKENPSLSVDYADKVMNYAKEYGYNSNGVQSTENKRTTQTFLDNVFEGLKEVVLGPVVEAPEVSRKVEETTKQGKKAVTNIANNFLNNIGKWLADNSLIAIVVLAGGSIVIFSVYDTVAGKGK